MKDSDLRSLILKQFYDLRREGFVGIRANGTHPLPIPEGVEVEDALRICVQLEEYGLIDWNGLDDNKGTPFAGAGKIRAAGVDVVDGDQTPPLPMNVSLFTQNVTVSNSTGVQIAGDNAHLQQTVTHHVENLIRAIEAAPVSEADKKEAKAKFGELLVTKAADAIFGASTAILLKMLGL